MSLFPGVGKLRECPGSSARQLPHGAPTHYYQMVCSPDPIDGCAEVTSPVESSQSRTAEASSRKYDRSQIDTADLKSHRELLVCYMSARCS